MCHRRRAAASARRQIMWKLEGGLRRVSAAATAPKRRLKTIEDIIVKYLFIFIHIFVFFFFGPVLFYFNFLSIPVLEHGDIIIIAHR